MKTEAITFAISQVGYPWFTIIQGTYFVVADNNGHRYLTRPAYSSQCYLQFKTATANVQHLAECLRNL